MYYNRYSDRFQIQQWVTHANQYKPVPEGEFSTADEAIAQMGGLVSDLGWSGLRVVDLANGDVLAESDDQ